MEDITLKLLFAVLSREFCWPYQTISWKILPWVAFCSMDKKLILLAAILRSRRSLQGALNYKNTWKVHAWFPDTRRELKSYLWWGLNASQLPTQTQTLLIHHIPLTLGQGIHPTQNGPRLEKEINRVKAKGRWFKPTNHKFWLTTWCSLQARIVKLDIFPSEKTKVSWVHHILLNPTWPADWSKIVNRSPRASITTFDANDLKQI